MSRHSETLIKYLESRLFEISEEEAKGGDVTYPQLGELAEVLGRRLFKQPEAKELRENLLEIGHQFRSPAATTELARLRLEQGLPEEAVNLFRLAMNMGYPLAETSLGRCYENGWGVEKNLAQAAYHYRHAAFFGRDEFAKYLLTSPEVWPTSGVADGEKGRLKLLKEAANAGVPPAALEYGKHCLSGGHLDEAFSGDGSNKQPSEGNSGR